MYWQLGAGYLFISLNGDQNVGQYLENCLKEI